MMKERSQRKRWISLGKGFVLFLCGLLLSSLWQHAFPQNHSQESGFRIEQEDRERLLFEAENMGTFSGVSLERVKKRIAHLTEQRENFQKAIARNVDVIGKVQHNLKIVKTKEGIEQQEKYLSIMENALKFNKTVLKGLEADLVFLKSFQRGLRLNKQGADLIVEVLKDQ